MTDDRSPDIVDWGIARRVARTVAGSGHPIPVDARPEVVRQFTELVERADGLVRDFTRLQPSEPAGRPVVFGRSGWVDANIEGFRGLIRPISERVAARAGPATRRIGGLGLGVQMGILLGYLAQKVLGQYDLLLAAGGRGKVYFVAPNIVGAERRWGLDSRDFRLWIALHEVTHRTQFVAVPWLRDHVAGLISRYLGSVELDPARVREAMRRLVETFRQGPESWRKATLLEIFLTPSQQEIVGEMQALMTVVEGHGNFVMDHVGQDQIPSYARLKEALALQRKTAGTAERTFQRAIGLEMKYRQYTHGQEFVEEIYAKAGMDGVNRLWTSSSALPAPVELDDPDLWLERVAVPEDS